MANVTITLKDILGRRAATIEIDDSKLSDFKTNFPKSESVHEVTYKAADGKTTTQVYNLNAFASYEVTN